MILHNFYIININPQQQVHVKKTTKIHMARSQHRQQIKFSCISRFKVKLWCIGIYDSSRCALSNKQTVWGRKGEKWRTGVNMCCLTCIGGVLVFDNSSRLL